MNSGFELRLARSGHSVQVTPEQTVVDALLTVGIKVPISCYQGICGTCVTTVLAGVPEHRDMYLTAEEQDSNQCFTPCCSRSRTAVLEIDL